MELIKHKEFSNGMVYALRTDDGYPVEVTDTFLPYYTKNAVGEHQNALHDHELGSRAERWMVGVSCMSGCPVRCKFCATGQLKKWRKLSSQEIVDQVEFVLSQRPERFTDAMEHKINYTRMGEPFLNIGAVRAAIEEIERRYPRTHHYVSTIGIKGSDFSWVKDNVTLQVSLHSLDEERRDDLIPITKKMSLEELGQITTESALKTTLNMTLVDEADFDIKGLKNIFDPKKFFIKLSPINTNCVSDANGMGAGIIEARNIE
jgi:adenine C2-methylase RlmN of 23S rRNA A2503 and tRNA A37